METARELFLKHDYSEAKDLCKQFLTLNVGVIVFSLTFADKVIEFSKTSEITRVVLLSSWSCIFRFTSRMRNSSSVPFHLPRVRWCTAFGRIFSQYQCGLSSAW